MTKTELHQLIDNLPEESVDGAGVLLRGILDGPIDADQAWFWTPAWQAGEREAHEQVVSGDGTVSGSTDDFVAHLEGSTLDDAA